MENFVVSARKYRPITFNTVVGQAHITNTLKNAIKNNHLAQAFLFTGPRGVGKTTCARILAKTINCENLNENLEACNTCKSCVSFNQSASFNVHELDAASNNSVEDIRNLVDQVRIPPQLGKYKIYIIDEVHMLSPAAFNAFLKTLEEPPAYAKFILATTEKHKIIPTILSRCQIFDFKRITVEDIAKHLAFVANSENITAEPSALHVVAMKADGALRDALSLFDQIVSFAGENVTYKAVIENLNVLDFEYYFTLTDFILENKITDILNLVNEVLDRGFDGHHFLMGLGEHLRCLLVSKDAATHKLLEADSGLKEKYQKQVVKCSIDFLLRSLDLVSKCDVQYKASSNKRLQLELTLIQMCNNLFINNNAGSQIANQTNEDSKKKVQLATTSNNLTKDSVVKPLESAQPNISKPITNKTTGIKPTISINVNKNKTITQDQTVEEKTNEPSINYNIEKHNISQSQFLEQWNNYTNSIAEANPNLQVTLAGGKPVLNNDGVVEITIENKIQEDEVKAKKLEIIEFLQQKLKIENIELKVNLIQKEQTIKPFTPTDKFNKLVEKNPKLNDLREQLDLEIDF